MQFKKYFVRIRHMMNQPLLPLNFAMLEQFRGFLDKQEAKLADALLLATIPAISATAGAPVHLHGSGHFRLAQALQIMTSRIRNLHEGEATKKEWASAVSTINQAFWDYVEILEGTIQELFEQMDGVDLNAWSIDYYQIITSFKELLAHRIEDLIWVNKRVEDLLLAYRWISNRQKNVWMLFGKLLSQFTYVLDKSLLTHLFKAEESLNIRFKSFHLSYEAMRVLIPEIQERETRFAGFPVFITLDQEHRNLIIQLYRLVALNEKNAKYKTLNQELLVTTIKNLAKPGFVSAQFRDYIAEIKKTFFRYCLNWQKEFDPAIKKSLLALSQEMDFLKNLIGSYREILLRSDSGPYTKTRWRLTEWIVGQEPRKTRDLLNLLYQIEAINKLFPVVNSKTGLQENWALKKALLKRQIEEVLHEMGQPLSSRNLIQGKAEKLIELIDETDELGGSLGDVRPLVSDVLLRAMHFDAKYQVLNEDPKFHELFDIHKNLMPKLNDPSHEKRIKQFQTILKHIEHWCKKREVSEHIAEIESEEATIHEGLQRFLGALQGQNNLQDDKRYLQMLLEYRYLFSQFFHSLRSFETEGKQLRSQFAFVDHYLEAIALHTPVAWDSV